MSKLAKIMVFAKIVSWTDVVTQIENTPTAVRDKPLSPAVIESIS